MGLGFCTTFFVAMVAAFLWLINLPPSVNLSLLQVSSAPSYVYDRNGNLLFTLPPQQPVTAPLSEIPVRLQDALIATEDAGFYQHSGFSLRGYARAALYDITHRDEAQGASTITQQLAKFVYLSDQKTLTRKLQQLLLSMQIARRFTKAQVLDMYFNRVYFGNGATGITAAAYSYFSVQPADMHQLTLEQCALLAGLPQAPSLYDPLVNPGLARTRRNEVLQRMLEQHYISQSQYQAAVQAPLELQPGGSLWPQVPQQDDYVRDYLLTSMAALHLGSALESGGLSIYTSIDPQLQQSTYDQINNTNYYPVPLSTATEQLEGSAVFLDPHTGGIEALVGGRQGQYTQGGFDYATQTQRSPGSAMKPLVAYGPAIQTGKWNANSALLDGKNNSLTFSGYTVSDWESHYTVNGYVTMRYALAESWNSPAVWLLDQIGIPTGIAFAEKAGIPLQSAANDNLTIALGNVIPGISPLILADAYASFDNNGVRIPPHLVDRVVGSNGLNLYTADPTPIQVMSPSTATQMVALLENNVVNGIVAGAAVPGHQVAGKTGSVAFTNQSHTDSDLWVAAFTPNVVGAVWEGYPTTTLANSLPQWSSKYPPEMFSAILRGGLPGTGQSFGIPPAVGPNFP